MALFEKGLVPVPDNRVSSLFAYIREQLAGVYEPEEARAMAFVLFGHCCKLSKGGVLSAKEERVNQSALLFLLNAVEKLRNHVPLQYITGTAAFYGHEFIVTPDVLIPRPETEELVEHMIVHAENVSAKALLDIGTGSGCIAVSLQLGIRGSCVTAWDISPAALAVASRNAAALGANVNFELRDILDRSQWDAQGNFDMIVSNPPYVKLSEKESMHANVTGHEPHLALFVPDEDPLIFYHAIADFAAVHLVPGGILLTEINAALGQEVAAAFAAAGLAEPLVIKDLSGKDRFLKAMRIPG